MCRWIRYRSMSSFGRSHCDRTVCTHSNANGQGTSMEPNNNNRQKSYLLLVYLIKCVAQHTHCQLFTLNWIAWMQYSDRETENTWSVVCSTIEELSHEAHNCVVWVIHAHSHSILLSVWNLCALSLSFSPFLSLSLLSPSPLPLSFQFLFFSFNSWKQCTVDEK